MMIERLIPSCACRTYITMMKDLDEPSLRLWEHEIISLLACWFQPELISQPTVFSSHNKPAPARTYQPKNQPVNSLRIYPQEWTLVCWMTEMFQLDQSWTTSSCHLSIIYPRFLKLQILLLLRKVQHGILALMILHLCLSLALTLCLLVIIMLQINSILLNNITQTQKHTQRPTTYTSAGNSYIADKAAVQHSSVIYLHDNLI